MNRTLSEIAESLLGRPLHKNDGIDAAIVEAHENRLHQKLPAALKEFYTLLGNLEMFTSSFEYFASPDQLEVKDGMIIFLEENQGVCFWAVKANDIENPLVYMCTDLDVEKPEWHPELVLDEFLKIILYLQCAEGGYEYIGAVYEQGFESRMDFEDFFAETTTGWEKVVQHNGFVAFQKNDRLIWCLLGQDGKMQGILYASARTEAGFEEMDALGFAEL